MPLVVPPVVQNKARLAGAAQWLDELPGVVDELADRWHLGVGDVFDGGTEALVVAVTIDERIPAVLKLLLPRDDMLPTDEITVLDIAGGSGCVELLDSDRVVGALLLERLGPSIHDLGLPLDDRTDILLTVAAEVWRPVDDIGLTTTVEKAAMLRSYIVETWAALDHPCSERAVGHTLACLDRRIASEGARDPVLLHGDIHQWNALRADDGFKLVDPDGLVGDPAYDLGVIIREDPEAVLVADPFSRARLFEQRTGVDANAIWEWGVAERVSTGLVATGIDLQPVGRDLLAAADHVATIR